MRLFTPARRIFFSISRAWPSSSSIMTMVTACCSRIYLSCSACRRPALRQRNGEGGPLIGDAVDLYRTAEASHQGANMGKTDALSRTILNPGAAEQVENAVKITPRKDRKSVV